MTASSPVDSGPGVPAPGTAHTHYDRQHTAQITIARRAQPAMCASAAQGRGLRVTGSGPQAHPGGASPEEGRTLPAGAMKFSVADVVRALRAALATAPSFCQKAYWCVTYRLSGTLDRLRKLDMVRHCKWIACGTDGLGGKGRTRMRPKLHLPVLGHAFRVTGFMA